VLTAATPRYETKLYALCGTNGGTVRTFAATVRLYTKFLQTITTQPRVETEQFTQPKNEQSYRSETEQSNTSITEQFEHC
jgi:hypothetical protein